MIYSAIRMPNSNRKPKHVKAGVGSIAGTQIHQKVRSLSRSAYDIIRGMLAYFEELSVDAPHFDEALTVDHTDGVE